MMLQNIDGYLGEKGMSNLTTEIAAYEAMQDELESTHLHEWVVFHGDTLLGTFDSAV